MKLIMIMYSFDNAWESVLCTSTTEIVMTRMETRYSAVIEHDIGKSPR